MRQPLIQKEPEAVSDQQISAGSHLLLAIEHWPVVLLATLLCGLLTTLFVLLGPKQFESSVTLLINPPTFRPAEPPGDEERSETEELTELMPRQIPVEIYRPLALAEDLLLEVRDDLELGADEFEGLKQNLRIELVELGSRTAIRGTQYAKMLVFRGTAPDPDQAAGIVQKWAELFKQRMDQLAVSGLEESFEFLSSRQQEALEELTVAEDALSEFRTQFNLDLLVKSKSSKEELLTQFENEISRTQVEIRRLESARTTLGNVTASENPKETLFQAPPAEIYWMSEKDLSTPPSGKITPEDGLRSEVLNPIYQLARTREVSVTENLRRSVAGRDGLEKKVRELRAEVRELQELIVNQRTLEERLRRSALTATMTFNALSRTLEKAKIARAHSRSDVEIVGRAVGSNRPSSGSSLGKIAVGCLMGALLGFFYLIARAFIARKTSKPLLRNPTLFPSSD